MLRPWILPRASRPRPRSSPGQTLTSHAREAPAKAPGMSSTPRPSQSGVGAGLHGLYRLVPDVVGFPFCFTQFTPAGLVMQAMPPGGEDISKGATVELYVCTGMGLPVPQAIGLPLGNAIQQLGAYGFRYTIHYSSAPSAEGIPAGVVWKQNPQAQITYTFGGAVTLWVESQAAARPMPKTTSSANRGHQRR
jgi:hypothetical protein